jgi:hypothetical protein
MTSACSNDRRRFFGGAAFDFLGFLVAFGIGLVNVIRNLSEMSIHVSSHMPSTPHSLTGGVEQARPNTTAAYESSRSERSGMIAIIDRSFQVLREESRCLASWHIYCAS